MKIFAPPTQLLRFLRRVFPGRRLAFAAAALTTLVAGFYIVENWRGERAWADAQDRLRAAGEPLTLEEYLPTPPPDDQNFLMNPVFVRRFGFGRSAPLPMKQKVEEVRAQESTGDYPPRFAKTADGTPLEFPYEALGESGSRPDMTAIAPFLPEEIRPPSSATQQQAAEAILKWTSKWEPDFATLAEAARTRPASYIPWASSEQLHANLDQMDGFVDMLNILQLRALAQVSAEDARGALESVMIFLRIGQAFASAPNMLVYHVTGEGAVQRLASPLNHALANGLWNDPQLHQLEDQLSRVDSRKSYRSANQAERFYVGEVMEQLIAGDTAFLKRIDPTRPWSMSWLAPRGWWRQNEAHAVSWWLEQKQRLSLPAANRPPSQIDSMPAHRNPHTMLLPLIIRGFEHLEQFTNRQEAVVALHRTAIALERYRLRQGRNPDALADVAQFFETTVPLDPFTGRQPVYAIEDGRPKLWSVGPNRRDDGGREDANGADDIVWAYPAP
jgi:hypothetical protein